MKKFLKKLSCALGTVMALTVISSAFPFVAEAKEQSFTLNGDVYEFDKKSEYEVDSTSPSSNADTSISLGNLSINGDIQKSYEKNGVSAYEISDGAVFSLDFKYISSLKNAGKDDWHLIEDGKDVVNGSELDDDIDYGALILQTSFDGSNWVDCKSYVNIGDDIEFGEEQINNIQLANGCFYRVIAAYEIEKRTKENRFIDDYDTKKIAQVYTFYASYKTIDTAPIGNKNLFYVGAKFSNCTVKTEKNNYASYKASKTIDSKDPHYNWDLGYFCLSGYTDKGDSDDVYLKKVGNKVKLTFHLDEDINKLHGNSDLKIENDNNGSDDEFKISPHNMKHGELIIRHTDSENVTEEFIYSDYLAALASPGADTAIQLFEEGDYVVHLDYAITKSGIIDSTTYYQTSFKFKIRNANCMVYIFDAKSSAELGNGDVTENGFRIDTAKSSYPKIQVKKEIFNNTQNGLIEDTKFNGAASDGEIFTDEGIYTIKAYNRYDDKLEPAVKTIYIGNNNILTAYTKHLNSSKHYEIAELAALVDQGYTITDDGDIIEPVIETTTITTPIPETSTTKSEVTTIATTTEPVLYEAPNDMSSYIPGEDNTNKSTLPIVGGGVGAVAFIGIVVAALKKKK